METPVSAVAPAAAAPAAVRIDPAKLPLTPMLRQYLEFKAADPEALLFFRLGDFYELFFDDAERAHAVLGVTLTSRPQGEVRIPMCGVPWRHAEGHLATLVAAGFKVAICDQMELPEKGIARREVVRVVTPGLAFQAALNDPRELRWLAAVAFEPAPSERVGLALLDATTGELRAGLLASAEAADELARARVHEVVVAKGELGAERLARLLGVLATAPSRSGLDDAEFEPARALRALLTHFHAAGPEGLGLAGPGADATAAAAALQHLRATQRAEPVHVVALGRIDASRTLQLDETALAHLEVLRTLRDGKRQGALLGVVDQTRTAGGARLLARWLMAPLAEQAPIEARHEAVEELHGQAVRRAELGSRLGQVADLERLTGRLVVRQGSPRDLGALSRSLLALPGLADELARSRAPLLAAQAAPLRALSGLSALLAAALVDEPPVDLESGGVIRTGFHAPLDRLVEGALEGKGWLARFEGEERARTGINSLKVRHNAVLGYFLEVTRANAEKVPGHYVRRQSMAGAERYVTPELLEKADVVLHAEERRIALERQLFEELRQAAVKEAPALQAAAAAAAQVDVLTSLASVAAAWSWCRPTIDGSGAIELEASRHPVVEQALQREPFVPNDLTLDREGCQLLLLTGPNMAGKSTLMRQVALSVLLAQAGSFVPARRARIGLCDRLFTRVGASDDLSRGQSTFMVEMTETSRILHHATERSLVVLDEIGRGTSTYDGLSLAWAVAEHLHDVVRCRALFATHYQELTDLGRERPRIRNGSMAVRETATGVVFLRRLVEGGASRSYGIEVAKLAGLPAPVVARARALLAQLELGALDEQGRPRFGKGRGRRESESQLGLFAAPPRPVEPVVAAPHPLELALAALKVDELTPLAALNLLAAWKQSPPK